MTDKEMKRIATLIRCYIYDDVNDNYSDNLEVLKYVLRINEEFIENWVTNILTHKDLWEEPKRITSSKVLESIYGADFVKELFGED